MMMMDPGHGAPRKGRTPVWLFLTLQRWGFGSGTYHCCRGPGHAGFHRPSVKAIE